MGWQDVRWQDVVDRAIELPVVPSYTRFGSAVRRRVDHWTTAGDYDLTGRTIVVTGATSGLGLSLVDTLARRGAGVVLVARDPAKAAGVAGDLEGLGAGAVSTVTADLGDLDAVRAAAAALLADHPRIDVLVHNAGALSADRRTNPQGTEMTVASQVVGPFLLTALLLERLRSSAVSRVLTVSSGGMYSQPLRVEGLEMGPDDYDGTTAYARAKRAQVTLNELWAAAVDPGEVVFHAMHPGWADTPGVRSSLPTFRKVVGPALRTPAEGADTLFWLAADDTVVASSGRFWHDRRPRPIHLLPSTRRSDTPDRREALWQWCLERAGVDDPRAGA
jgi:dehydrogenase/reductase SDR family member 12